MQLYFLSRYLEAGVALPLQSLNDYLTQPNLLHFSPQFISPCALVASLEQSRDSLIL